ncbi:MAG TPA: hypothetical protein VGY31_01995 [Terriglobia bacterium]|nr:hypothetical protein [Terriglobia bacterium]
MPCHSESFGFAQGKLREESAFHGPQKQILRGVYPEPNAEILRSAQDDERRAQNDTGRWVSVVNLKFAA